MPLRRVGASPSDKEEVSRPLPPTMPARCCRWLLAAIRQLVPLNRGALVGFLDARMIGRLGTLLARDRKCCVNAPFWCHRWTRCCAYFLLKPDALRWFQRKSGGNTVSMTTVMLPA